MVVRAQTSHFHEVSYLSDGPALASASETGHISLWDLSSSGRLLHTIRGAHDGSISSLQWIPGQPLLISSGDDNSIKVRERDGKYRLFAETSTSNGTLIR